VQICFLKLCPKTNLFLWGKVGKGVKPSFQNVSLRKVKRRGVSNIGGGKSPLLQLHPKDPISSPRTQWGVSSLNRGGEQTLLELYPKRILSLSRGKAEILRYAQDDTSCRLERGTFTPFDWRGDVSLRSTWHKKSLFGVSWEGGLYPIPNNLRSFASLRTTKIRSVGKGSFAPSHYVSPRTQWGVSSLYRRGRLTFLQLHPKTNLCLWGKFEGGLLTPSINWEMPRNAWHDKTIEEGKHTSLTLHNGLKFGICIHFEFFNIFLILLLTCFFSCV